MSVRARLRAALGAVATSAALLAASATAPTVAAGADCPQPPPSSQTSQVFTYTGYPTQFAVPQWVDKLRFTVRGGHGSGSTADSPPGGRPGVVTGVLPVAPGSCLDIVVGGYGGGFIDGAPGLFGHGTGGEGGVMTGGGLQPRAGQGGGGSSIAPREGVPLVVAGGGGGGGANGAGAGDPNAGTPGGAGGDGANGLGPGTPQGEAGSRPPHGYPDKDIGPAEAGQPGQGNGANGEDGIQWEFAEVLCGNLSGGGGGGGGGYVGGGAGEMVIPFYADQNNQRQCLAGFGFGGGGGAGGDSFAASSVQDAAFTVDTGSCPFAGQQVPECWGRVELDWSIDIAGIAPAGGGRQSASIGARYPGLLQARVTAKDGAPIPGLAVTFTLPEEGATGSFETGAGTPRVVVVETDAAGVATAPPVVANDVVGAFTATASVAGVSQPARFSLTNDPAATATSLWTVPANPSVTLEPVQFVAQVQQAPSTAPTPIGVVVFLLDGDQISVKPVDQLGSAISDPVALGTGAHAVRAVYFPNDQFRASQAAISQHVERASTAVEIDASSNPSEDGDPVSFTATVDPVAPGAGTPTGAVVFTVDDRPLGDPVQLRDGRATSAAIRLDAGRHEVEASYEGDEGYDPSEGSFVQSVGATATATVLRASPRNPVVGQAAQITATVRPPAADSAAVPDGGVDIFVDGELVCDGVTLDAEGSATCSVRAPPLPGPHAITASYLPGSPGFDPSDGALSQRVSPGRVQVQLEATPDPSVFGEAARLHAQVGAAAPASGEPSGAVTFTVDGAPIGDPVLLRDGRADSIAIPRLDAGPHVLRATYSGDASFAANAVGATQAVDRGQTLGTITSSEPGARVGAAPRFTLRLGVAPPGSGQPGGLVQFSVDGAPWGPPVALENGVAVSAPVGGLVAGAHLVRAAYLGAAGFDRVDAQMTQWIAEPSTPLAPPGGGGGPGTPTAPAVRPPRTRSALLCARPLALTAVGAQGRRVRIAGRAQAGYAGQRVAIVSGGRVLARPRVAADGSFAARVPRPRAGAGADTMYVAIAGSARSAAVALDQRLRIVSLRPAGAGRVRLQAVLSAPARAQRLQVLRRIGCGRAQVVARPRAHLTREGRRFVVTLRRPSARQGEAAIWVAAGSRHVSLARLVAPAG